MDSTEEKREQKKETPKQAQPQPQKRVVNITDDKEKLLADAVRLLGEVSAGDGLKAFAEALFDTFQRNKDHQAKQDQKQSKDQQQALNKPETVVETVDLMDFMREQQVKMNRQELDAWEIQLTELKLTTADEELPLQSEDLQKARDDFEAGNKMAVYELLAENKLATQVLPEIETVRIFKFAVQELENTEELNKSYEAFKNGELDAVDKYLGAHAPELALAYEINKANGQHIVNSNVANDDERKAELQQASDKFTQSTNARGQMKKYVESEITGIEQNVKPQEISQVLKEGVETFNKVYNLVGQSNGEDSPEIQKTLQGKLSPTNVMDLKKARNNPDDQQGKKTVISVTNDAVKRDVGKKISAIKAKQGIKQLPKKTPKL